MSEIIGAVIWFIVSVCLLSLGIYLTAETSLYYIGVPILVISGLSVGASFVNLMWEALE